MLYFAVAIITYFCMILIALTNSTYGIFIIRV